MATPADHGNPGHKVITAILSALGGTEATTYERDPQTGKLVATTPKAGPGQAAKRIIAGALTGMAAGAGAKPGPGQTARAFAAGFDANRERLQTEDDKARQNADEDYKIQQARIVQNAQVAHLNQQIAESVWNVNRQQGEVQMEAAKVSNAFAQMVEDNPSNQDMGTFASFDEFLKSHGANADEIARLQTSRGIRSFPEIRDGKVVGVHVWKIDPSWDQQRNAAPVQIPFTTIDKDGRMKTEYQTIPAGGAKNGDILTYLQTDVTRRNQLGEKMYEQEQQNRRSRETNQTALQEGRERNATALQVAKIGAQSREQVASGKVSRQDIRDHDKNYVLPAEATEKSYQMMQHAYDEYKAARSQGKELPTGAQSMLALSTHLATTFGNVKGSRVTKDMIEHHMGARGVSDTARVAIQRLTNGDALSPDQWEAFHDLIKHSRQLSWESATKEAKRKNIPVDFLPGDLQSLAGEQNNGGGGDYKVGDVVMVNGQRLKITAIGQDGKAQGVPVQ